jgi:hypothetical protein
VYRSDESPVATTGTPLNATPVTEPAFVDDDVVAGATYHYVVIALADGLPNSASSNEASITVPSAAVAPTAPANVTATADADSINVAWAAVEGATGYKVFRGAAPQVDTTGSPLSGAAPVTGSSFDDATAVVGLTYYYVVVALGEGNTASKSPWTTSGLLFRVTVWRRGGLLCTSSGTRWVVSLWRRVVSRSWIWRTRRGSRRRPVWAVPTGLRGI